MTMDYEKKYNEALERAREYHSVDIDNTMDVKARGIMEYLFPELQESEDERVRKALLEMVHDTTGDELWVDYNVHKEEALAWLEKQGEVESDNDNIEVEEKGIREAFNKIEDEEQCKQKPQRMISAEAKEAMYNKPADTVEQKFKVKYAGSEYNVLEIKEIAGDTYYGIEDEPNHIDYVLPDNCEIVSEQKSAWSEEDEKMLECALDMIEWYSGKNEDKSRLVSGWLKSLKERYTWKPSDEQLEIIDMLFTNETMDDNVARVLRGLEEQLKKLREDKL